MGKRRIFFENCLMAITVKLCHVASTFQTGGKRGAKKTQLVGSSFPASTPSRMEVVVWKCCHLPVPEGWWREAQESLVPSLWWQWSCMAQPRSIGSRAAVGAEGAHVAFLHRARAASVLPRGAWWHHDALVARSPNVEAGFSPSAFP